MPAQPSVILRFGVFEVDLAAGEVRRAGLKVRLQEQPFQVLAVLLEHPGDVVTREDLRQRLWPGDTFVDFDHSLNTAINKLREALGDSADSPRYVETVPKRGYRFVAPVEKPVPAENRPPALRGPLGTPRERIFFLAGLLLAAFVAGVVWITMGHRRPAGEQVLQKFTFAPPGGAVTPVVSPDGKHIAYVSGAGAKARLWIQDLDRFEPREVNGSAGVLEYPFWSFDSRQIGFAVHRRLWRAPTAGGDPVIVCEFPDEYLGGAWNPDGASILFSVDHHGLLEVPARGGTPKPILKPDPQRWNHFDAPQFLPPPHSSHLLFIAQARTGRHVSVVHSLATGRQEVVNEDGGAAYSPTGHMLSLKGSLLWVTPFSPGKTSAGQGFPIAQTELKIGVSVSLDGTLVYQGGQLLWRLRWRDRGGGELDVIEDLGLCSGMALSPDGGKAAVSQWENSVGSLWIWDFARRTRTRMSPEPGNGSNPVWRPSGEMLAFASSRRGNWDIYTQPADGSRPATVLVAGPLDEHPLDWSTDGKILVYLVVDPARITDIWYLQQKNGSQVYESRPFLQTPWRETAATLSPNGRFLAYQSDESGRPEVYVMRFPEGGGRLQVSADGGAQPRWRRDGRELFYLAGDTLMAVPVNTVPAFSAGGAKPLFEEPNVGWATTVGSWRVFDPSPDGQRFLMAVPDAPTPTPIRVVRNWYAEFRGRPGFP